MMDYVKNARVQSEAPSTLTTPEKFENAEFISTVRPAVHTNLYQKRSFSKTFFKPEKFGNTDFAFSKTMTSR